MEFAACPVGPIQENAYVLYAPDREDALVIDPGAEPERVRALLDGRKLLAVLLTHGHYDHVGAVAALRGPDAPVYIHGADAAMLTDPRLSLAGIAAPAPGPADLFLTEGGLTLAGLRLQVIHTPGHTPGSVCYRCGNDLFSGDTMFRAGYGRVDLPGGDARQMALSLRRLLSFDENVRVHPGHGASTRIGAERRYGL